MKSQTDVVVIGSGLGGLAAACTLAARGHRVTVVEKNAWVGGKAAVLEDRGYRFDMGPTILTLPSVLRRIFSEAGRRLRIIWTWCVWILSGAVFEDGTHFDLVESLPQMQQHLREFTGSDRTGQGYEKFMAISKQLDEVSQRFFFWKSVGGIGDTMDLKQSFSLSVLRDVLSLRFGRTVAGMVRSHIPDVANRPDDGPLHAVCGFFTRGITGSALWHRTHADERGHLVSHGRNASRS
ncbi:MAG UNVERIFIED_CONTAM: FAD-dependent oxidoreductase [Planctomycetaceae bacterium]|jgi:phytoene dehydrogenase-like protein